MSRHVGGSSNSGGISDSTRSSTRSTGGSNSQYNGSGTLEGRCNRTTRGGDRAGNAKVSKPKRSGRVKLTGGSSGKIEALSATRVLHEQRHWQQQQQQGWWQQTIRLHRWQS